MQTAVSERVYYYISGFLLYVCMILLVWTVSPISFLKPNTKIGATPVVQYATVKESGKPVKIVLPSIGLDLPVSDGLYDTANGTWTIGNHKAYYATPTPAVNNRLGTTLIYGHNNKTAFRTLNLNAIPENAELIVYTDNGKAFHYTFMYAHEVTPDDISMLTLRGYPKVALQTCSGNWNEWRKIFMFKFTSVEQVAQDA